MILGDPLDTLGMSAPLPGPAESRRPGFAMGLLVGLLLMLVVALTWALLTRGSDQAEGSASQSTSVSSSPSVGPSPSPSVSPKPEKPPAVVKSLFNKNHAPSKGERLSFSAFFIDYPSDQCNVHTYAYAGTTQGAFMSDCRDWASSGKDILLFDVGFENTSKKPATLVLRNLVLTDRNGRTYAPVNVRSEADYPPYFLNESQRLPPGGKWSGWVTFDGRVLSLVPASLSYIDGSQTLVQVFAGKHAVVPPSG